MWHIQRPLQRKVLSIENKTLTKPSHLAEKFSACEKALIFIVFMRCLNDEEKVPVISFEDFSFQYRAQKKPTLTGINLNIYPGEKVLIAGPSGSGKSTLLKIIGCMDTPTAGKYFLDDTEVTAASRSQVHKLRKEKIGYVFQHFALMDYYTAYENIELPLLAANVKRKERKRIILKQMEHLGILSERNKLPGKMSGGQQQRVAIARALVTNADIILADEPTGALDQKTGHEVLELLKEINKSGKTVIIVTHDEGIAKMTDRIITISDGRIVGDSKEK